jgi:8-oxo-dGTP diphosphatase
MTKKDKERKQVLSCGGVVWRSHEGHMQLLLVKQFAHKDRWGIPKGHICKDESPEQCAVREIFEETGVHVSLGLTLPEVIASYRDEDKTVMSWLAEVVGPTTPRHDGADSEVADAQWFDIDRLPSILVYQQPVIATAIQRLLESSV